MYFLFWGVITAWGNVFTPVCDSAHMGETLGGLCLGGESLSRGKGVSVQRMGYLSRGSLSGGLCSGGLCPGGLCPESLCPGGSLSSGGGGVCAGDMHPTGIHSCFEFVSEKVFKNIDKQSGSSSRLFKDHVCFVLYLSGNRGIDQIFS